MSFDILNRWTSAVLYSAASADDIASAVIEAARNWADLSRADLFGANLFGASLSRANLFGANLSGANLSGANLSRADLSRANLSGANLSGADLSRADLFGANLFGADLFGANLSRANLFGADGLKHPILQIPGSRHWIVVMSRDEVCVGCHRRPMAEWLKKYKAIGRAEDYTKEQIVEYGEHLKYAERWLATVEAAVTKPHTEVVDADRTA